MSMKVTRFYTFNWATGAATLGAHSAAATDQMRFRYPVHQHKWTPTSGCVRQCACGALLRVCTCGTCRELP